ncbi:MAG: SIR2 family protein [Myxococcales bacterium]|nr:SIR2 family protein [Myxococcales bacterium]
MAGHLFVVHGDLRTLHCDHWLLPVDSGLSASRSWNRTATWKQIWPDLPRYIPDGSRVLEVPWTGPRRPWPTNVASGSRTAASWQARSVREFLVAAAAAGPTLEGRERPLLALPVVGTGYGGKRRWAGDVLRAILPEIYDCLQELHVDVALVTWTEQDFAAAQATRRECASAGRSLWPDALGPKLRARAQELALLAARNRLVVFMGAGVSANAGLPTWTELLDRLAEGAGFTERERRGMQSLGPLDQAQLIARRLGPEPQALGNAVKAHVDLGDTVAISHALLAGLPVNEFITTNYDDGFERACAAIRRPVARLPYAPATNAERWLLKMHGCVTAPGDIVLTRQDYLRYAERSAALAGIVQAMLITRHMLFVGFSLNDDNFHRIVDAVRRALVGAERDGLGSVVSLMANPVVEQLWGDDLQWIHLAGAATTERGRRKTLASAARRFDIFLDCLSFHAAAPSHVLNPRFEALLSDGERALREALQPAREWLSAHPNLDASDPASAAWARVAALLSDLGG